MPSSQTWNSDGSKTSTSKPFPVKVGSTTTNYTVKTETNITQGNVEASKLTLQDTVTLRSGKEPRALATSTDGGKTWIPTKDSDGKDILSKDQIKSLQSGGPLSNAVKNASKSDAKSNGANDKQVNQLTVGNAATANAGISTSGDSINLEQSQTNLENLKIDGSDKTRKVTEYPNSNNLRYPITLKTTEQDCITFTMLEYKPKPINLGGLVEGRPLGDEKGTRGDRIRGSTVTLPIQPSISDSNTVNWGSDEMNAGQLIAASAALATITEGSEGASASVKGITDLFKGSAESLKTAFAAGFADKAAGTKGLLTRVTGGIINPNMELLFNGPQLRNFSFTFTLSAREPDEAKVIRNIIRFFKQGMSVKRASTGLFLKSPHTFEIKYLHKNNEHPWINKIKECALTGCNVNYTPAGNYATYYDGSMTSYEISLTFGELEPVYDDDYGKGSTSFDTEIGY